MPDVGDSLTGGLLTFWVHYVGRLLYLLLSLSKFSNIFSSKYFFTFLVLSGTSLIPLVVSLYLFSLMLMMSLVLELLRAIDVLLVFIFAISGISEDVFELAPTALIAGISMCVGSLE